MATTALDQLRATRAALVTLQSQIGGAIADIDTALNTVTTSSDVTDMVAQVMASARAAVASEEVPVTPDVTPVVPATP